MDAEVSVQVAQLFRIPRRPRGSSGPQTLRLLQRLRQLPGALLVALLPRRDARQQPLLPLRRAALVRASCVARRRAPLAMTCRRMARRARWTMTRCRARHRARRVTPSLRVAWVPFCCGVRHAQRHRALRAAGLGGHAHRFNWVGEILHRDLYRSSNSSSPKVEAAAPR
jgi:hypothetical protein